MKVTLDNGGTVDLGITEVSPTVGITDYSRRVTDDFGVTTVVRRGFARRMSLRFAVDYTAVDAVQAQLADLRATPALWVADDRYRALAIRGIFKDFDIDLAVPPQSYCSLTVDGLAESDVAPDPGGDPAVSGTASTLRLIQPVTIDDGVLTASNVPENDAPAWAAGTTYGDAARVIAGHRVFESLTAGNVGNDPLTTTGKWVEVGPTNRWAAFDQALGTVTTAAAPIVVTLASGTADALALLDVTGVAVRVQANGYDRTQAVAPGALTFTDLPGGAVTVTIAGPGTVSVGTLLIGRMVALGVTEASPTAGITDYSRKEVDDFGEVAIVQRAWSKRMQARALIRADAVDTVFDRIAALRAVPALWIGDADSDALTIYGFFKDFSIEIGDTTAKLSLTVEGLSRAAKIEPITAPVSWEEVTDPHGTKPANNADVTGENVAKDTVAVGGKPSGDLLTDITTNSASMVRLGADFGVYKQTIDPLLYGADGTPIVQQVQEIGVKTERFDGFYRQMTRIDPVTGTVMAMASVAANGVVSSFTQQAGPGGSITGFFSDIFVFWDRNGGGPPIEVLKYEAGRWKMTSIEVDTIKARSIITDSVLPGAISGLEAHSAPDKLVSGGETVLIEVTGVVLGDGQDGRGVANLSFVQDGTSQVDTGMMLRFYIDSGSGWTMVSQQPSGIRVNGGDAYWILPVALPIALLSSGTIAIRVTAAPTKISNSGNLNSSWARNIQLVIFKGYR